MPKVGLLWRAEWDPPAGDGPIIESCKLREMFHAFSVLGVPAEPVVYSDDTADAVKDQLLGLDGVLVWVNPIEQELDRAKLDSILREVADAGVWVSAHPDVILKMATKQVLVDTKQMSWGTDTTLYRSSVDLREDLSSRLLEQAPLVLKQNRGMGGNGVWKVEWDSSGGDRALRVQHAVRGSVPELVSVDEFVERCEPYFALDGLMIGQPYQARLPEGLVRVYMTHDQVVGFAHQYPRGLLPTDDTSTPQTAKKFDLPSAPAYRVLRGRMESQWVPEMLELLSLDKHTLPVIWDADFLYGAKTSGDDRYVLCEINASSTFAFPEHAMPAVAKAATQRIQERKSH